MTTGNSSSLSLAPQSRLSKLRMYDFKIVRLCLRSEGELRVQSRILKPLILARQRLPNQPNNRWPPRSLKSVSGFLNMSQDVF